MIPFEKKTVRKQKRKGTDMKKETEILRNGLVNIANGNCFYDDGIEQHHECSCCHARRTLSKADQVVDEHDKPSGLVHKDAFNQVNDELQRAHAAIHWFAKVRAVIANGVLADVEGEDGVSFVEILAVAHALSEVWLSGAPVTARAVADLLGWYSDGSEHIVWDCLLPLMHETTSQLVILGEEGTVEDFLPNIKS